MLTGEKIEFIYKNNDYKGIFISSDDEKTTIKLDNGYNITLKNENINIKNAYKNDKKNENIKIKKIEKKGKNNVYILTTGGTIGSSIDYETGAVKPVKDISYLYDYVNNINDYNLFHDNIDNILSENVDSKKWINFARKAKEKMDNDNGVIIFHGTDTMQYSAAALAFMFEEQTNPIIFTGSQRSSDRPSSDAFKNIEGSIHFSSLDIGEVCVAMHYNTSDNNISLHRGVRVRKMHTSKRDAFKTINNNEIAFYNDNKIKINSDYKKTGKNNILNDKLNNNVSIVYFYPGMREEDFYNIVYNKNAVIIMGTGLGHVSENIINVIKKLSKDVYFFMTSQCIYGGVNLNVYSTGRELLKAGVIPLYDILPETAMVKAMYLLANYNDNFVNLMKTNLRGEIDNRILW